MCRSNQPITEGQLNLAPNFTISTSNLFASAQQADNFDPCRYEPATCSGAVFLSNLGCGSENRDSLHTMFNVFYVIHHSMIMKTKNGLQM